MTDKNRIIPFHQELLDKLERGVTLDGPVSYLKGPDSDNATISAYGDNYMLRLDEVSSMAMEETYDQESTEEFYDV